MMYCQAKYLFVLSFMFISTLTKVHSQQNQQVIPLYKTIPNEVPGLDEENSQVVPEGWLKIEKVRKPTLTVYLPPKEKANGTAVVICPGGGYAILAASHEGSDIAKKFNEQGVAAFVLKYRLPSAKTSSNPEIAPLQDAQQALLLVRENAKKWNIDPSRVGIMGFSAGGHLASTAGTHFQKSYIDNPKSTSVRPDFMLLIYPVISRKEEITHQGSFNNLLGDKASTAKIEEYSNELQVTSQTPPTFLVHASDDDVVHANNSVLFYQSLLKNNVPAELHLYQAGGHGFGLKNPTTKDLWFDRCLNWFDTNKLLNKR
ncbi:alpha/beta hydrolase [Pontibacter harenae]|uniref:alpha/beta hydrolase n=1 Tax=Pontibacter harenae TaxID=2894083 RepID=UPI001E4C256D|nr:alpha/beta hydrolase [Pontibacter harenae]MCC9167405.1 alpha/beta hydrolase [Pontibacter harenae]